MRIRKTDMVVGAVGKVLNNYTNSNTTDTYSCNYINSLSSGSEIVVYENGAKVSQGKVLPYPTGYTASNTMIVSVMWASEYDQIYYYGLDYPSHTMSVSLQSDGIHVTYADPPQGNLSAMFKIAITKIENPIT